MNPPTNHYETLGLSPAASKEEIKSAYRKLAQKNHPDKAGPENVALFQEINTAYQTLSDPEKRRDYDAMMRGGTPLNTNHRKRSSFEDYYADIFRATSGRPHHTANQKGTFNEKAQKNTSRFATSAELKAYAEKGIRATSTDELRSHAQAAANAIKANPALLDQNSVSAVAKLVTKTPSCYYEHTVLNSALETHGTNIVTDAAFEDIRIEGSTLVACAKFLTSKTLKAYAEKEIRATSTDELRSHAQAAANAINANPALLDQNSVRAVAKLVTKTPSCYYEHTVLNSTLETHGTNIVTDAAFEDIRIEGSTLVACAKFLTSKTLKAYAEKGIRATSTDELRSHAQAAANAINANPALLDQNSVRAVAELVTKTPSCYYEHTVLNSALETHGTNIVTDAAFEDIRIEGSTLVACAKFLTSKTLKAYAEKGIRATSTDELRSHAQAAANAINANPALLDQNSVRAVAELVTKTPSCYYEHTTLNHILSTYQASQNSHLTPNFSGPQP